MVLRGCLFIFSVLMLKTEERVWVFLKHKLLHKQLDSLAVSWKKNPASLSMEHPSLSSFISQTQVQPSQQKIFQTSLRPYYLLSLQTDEPTKNEFTYVVGH